ALPAPRPLPPAERAAQPAVPGRRHRLTRVRPSGSRPGCTSVGSNAPRGASAPIAPGTDGHFDPPWVVRLKSDGPIGRSAPHARRRRNTDGGAGPDPTIGPRGGRSGRDRPGRGGVRARDRPDPRAEHTDVEPRRAG